MLPDVTVEAPPEKRKKSSSSEGNPRKRSKFDAPRRSAVAAPPKEAIEAIQRIASNHMSNMQLASSKAEKNDVNAALIAEKLKELEKSTDEVST